MNRTRVVGLVGAAVVGTGVAGGIVATLVGRHAALPGLLTGPAPWGPNRADLSARLDDLGLGFVRALVFHSKVHLDIYVDGRRVKVPEAIGIPRDRALLVAPAFTSGHGTFSVRTPLRLGALFGIWGVRFTRECLGGYCDEGEKRIRVFVNGAPVPGDPRNLPLADRQELVVAYGTPAELPRPVPASYPF